MELRPPLVGRLQPVDLEQVVQEREQHRVVVRQHEQVHRQQVGARLGQCRL